MKHNLILASVTVVLLSAISTMADQEAIIHCFDESCTCVSGINTYSYLEHLEIENRPQRLIVSATSTVFIYERKYSSLGWPDD